MELILHMCFCFLWAGSSALEGLLLSYYVYEIVNLLTLLKMSVKHWLESLAMTQYHESFLNSGFNTLAKCSKITDSDLDRIGVVPLGHRRRLLSHLKTALEFSVPRSEVAEEQTLLEVPEKCPSPKISQAVEIGDLIDLQSPVIKNAVGAEPKQYPIDVPPKTRKISIDDVLGALDRNSDSDRKRPVPLPRTSAHAIRPVPKPRIKKPSLQNILGAASHSSVETIKTRDDAEGSKQLNFKGNISLDCRNLDDCREKISSDDSVMCADMPSNFVSCMDSSEVVEPDLSLALDSDTVSKTSDEHSLCETNSPDNSSVILRLPVSASYEGDVEDIETPGGEVFFGLSRPESSVCDGISEDGAIRYMGVWDMTSGAAVGRLRHEIRSDTSFDEIPAFKRSQDDEKAVQPDVASTALIVPLALCSDATVPAQPQLLPSEQSNPPPLPARKLDLKCSASAPSEFPSKDSGVSKNSSTRLILSDVGTYASDPSLKPPMASEAKIPAETTGEVMVDRPQFPIPPVPTEISEKDAKPHISPQNSRSPPHAHGGSVHRRILQPPLPPSLVGTVPPLVGDISVPFSAPSSIPLPSLSDSLDVKVLMQPARIGPPPPLPPKVCTPVIGTSEETPYLLAGCLEDEDLNDEIDFPGDGKISR